MGENFLIMTYTSSTPLNEIAKLLSDEKIDGVDANNIVSVLRAVETASKSFFSRCIQVTLNDKGKVIQIYDSVYFSGLIFFSSNAVFVTAVPNEAEDPTKENANKRVDTFIQALKLVGINATGC